MKVALVNPNYHDRGGRPPLGLLSIATCCKQAGYDVRIVDANLMDLSDYDVSLETHGADVIGITATTPTIHEAQAIARFILQESPSKPIVLGGVHASVFPEECLLTGLFDTVVVGEGETAFLEILRCLQKGQKPANIYRLWSVDLNQIPVPDYSLIDTDAYRPRYPHGQFGKWTAASTSRGCPHSCIFCYKGISGHTFRAMSSEKVIELLDQLVFKHEIRDITLYDDLFTLDVARVIEICNWLIGCKAFVSWTCESRVNMARLALLEKMYHAGCRMIYYGIESGNQTVLNRLRKGISLNQVRQAVRVTQEAGIKAAGYFMLGCPGETRETMRETVEFAKELRLDHAQFSVCSPLPGSELFDEYVKAGYPVPDWSNFRYLGDIEKPMFMSHELSREDIEQAVKKANEFYYERIA